MVSSCRLSAISRENIYSLLKEDCKLNILTPANWMEIDAVPMINNYGRSSNMQTMIILKSCNLPHLYLGFWFSSLCASSVEIKKK